MLTCREAARQAGVSLPTLNGWIRSGYLPVEQKKRRRVIRQSDLAVAQSLVHAGVVVPIWRQDPSRAGRRLRALREAAGFSQLDLAAASGLTHEAIARYTGLPLGTVKTRIRRGLLRVREVLNPASRDQTIGQVQ